jgi:hypothetical protein
MAYDVGDTAILEATFTDAITNAPINPTSVIVAVLDPLGDLVSPAPVATVVSTGLWRAELPLTLPGVYRYRFTGSGAASGVETRTLAVRAPEF